MIVSSEEFGTGVTIPSLKHTSTFDSEVVFAGRGDESIHVDSRELVVQGEYDEDCADGIDCGYGLDIVLGSLCCRYLVDENRNNKRPEQLVCKRFSEFRRWLNYRANSGEQTNTGVPKGLHPDCQEAFTVR